MVPGIGVVWPQESKKIIKPKVLYDKQVVWSNSLNVYSNKIVYILRPILKPKLKMLMYEKI